MTDLGTIKAIGLEGLKDMNPVLAAATDQDTADKTGKFDFSYFVN